MICDVSHHNGNINWRKVKDDGVTAVYIKASQGSSFTDPKAYINASGAKENGLKIGYYHFATLNNSSIVSDAKTEAAYFISVVDRLPGSDLPLVLDIESEDPKVQLSDQAVLQWIQTFFSIISSTGKDYALYSYTPFLNDHLPPSHNLGRVKLWLAAYTSAGIPRIPTGWSSYWMWQYTDKGRVNGITTYVDLNKLNV